MSINKNTDEKTQNHTEAYYEELASQEEIYLEEREERARAILISETPSPSGCQQLSFESEPPEVKTSVTVVTHSPHTAKSSDEQLNHAAEELITGDSDDPPLSDETVEDLLE
jgi:hypothetical protein